LSEIIFNRRHLKTMIIILVQNFTSMPLSIRKLFTNCVCFKPAKKEFEILTEELFEMSKDDAINIMKYVYRDPHDYLVFNVDTQRFYRFFDKLILHNKEKDNSNI